MRHNKPSFCRRKNAPIGKKKCAVIIETHDRQGQIIRFRRSHSVREYPQSKKGNARAAHDTRRRFLGAHFAHSVSFNIYPSLIDFASRLIFSTVPRSYLRYVVGFHLHVFILYPAIICISVLYYCFSPR